MKRALSLARQALGKTSPNPAVGAVIVKDGVIVGEGYTQPPGSAHAEVVALQQAGEAARGATMWVTLEPCCHSGRTPPCTQAVIAAGVTEVHLAMLDPNPLVSGQGKKEIERASIKIYLGEYEEEASELNEAYAKFITTGLPFIIAKFAMSLDGKIATKTGNSKWISGERSREYAQALRQAVDAIMVGVNTVLADDPLLTVRLGEPSRDERQPLRVIVDSHGRTPPVARVFGALGKTLVASAGPIESAKAKQLVEAGAELLELPSYQSQVDLRKLMRALGEREIMSVLVEGGGTLLGSLFDLGLVDKVYVIIAPLIIGGRDAVPAVSGNGVDNVEKALRLSRTRVDRLDQDILISGYIRKDNQNNMPTNDTNKIEEGKPC